jgi:hypothetical protein
VNESVTGNGRPLSVVMISTTDALGGRADLLERMLNSVAAFADTSPAVPLRLLMLVQRADRPEQAAGFRPNGFLDAIATPERMSLSAARNLLIERARAAGLFHERSVVLFPDDDCWYPNGALRHIVDAFTVSAELDLWFCRYSASPDSMDGYPERPAKIADVVRKASSNTLAVRGHLLAGGLRFDETLGVGTPDNGGEDTAFAIAAFGRSRSARVLDGTCIGHRDPDRQFVARYYRGALFAIARNHNVPGTGFELLRKLAVGAVLMLQRRLGLRHFTSSAGIALATFLRPATRRSPST